MTYALTRLLRRSRRNLDPKCIYSGNGGSCSWLLNDRFTVEVTAMKGNNKPYIHRFSTGFTSVHGEKPSSEYAKQRKESLEIEFGQILGSRSKTSFAYHQFAPFLALYRAAIIISFQVVKFDRVACILP